MKTCPNCFRTNTDEAEHCQECGIKFAIWKGAKPLADDPKKSDKTKSQKCLNKDQLVEIVLTIGLGLFGLVIIAILTGYGVFVFGVGEGDTAIPVKIGGILVVGIILGIIFLVGKICDKKPPDE